MSRRGLKLLGAVAAIGGSAGAAAGQEAADRTAQSMIDTARAAYGPISPEQRRKACRSLVKEGEIVVCAPDDWAQYRVESSTELDPTSRAALRDGLPRAPDVAGAGIFSGPATLGGLCLIPPCPPAPMYMIDLSTIPETPKGSDAEKVANGEMSDR